MITTEQVKSQCRIDDGAEDSYIDFLIGAAKSSCLQSLNRPVFETAAELQAAVDKNAGVAEFGMVVTEDIKLAILLTVAHFYDDREGTGELPISAKALLRQWRKSQGV